MKIALIENFAEDFYKSRTRLTDFLIDCGYDITCIVPKDKYSEMLRVKGYKVIELESELKNRDLKSIISIIKELRSIFVKNNFDVIHSFRLQPNLFSAIANFGLRRNVKLINHVTGLGVAFSKNGLKYTILRKITILLYQFNYRISKARFIFQNDQDNKDLNIYSNYVVIKGSSVNENLFSPPFRPVKELRCESSLKVLFVSRFLKEKGIIELLEAFRKGVNPNVKLILVGYSDYTNPECISKEELNYYLENNSNVIFLGKRDDVQDVINDCDVCILPTYYREGTPRFLLESMLMSKAIITTDSPGCNHLLLNNNGFTVEKRSVDSISSVINRLEKKDLEDMGKKGRELYFEQFSEKVVFRQIRELYIQ